MTLVDMPPASDYLALLKGELIEHVRRARGALDGAADAVDDSASGVCVSAMQQVQGVLATLGLELLNLLAEELARVSRDLGTLSGEPRVEALAALRNGLDQLRENIERQAAGRGEDAWGLVAALNELRAGSALPLVSESGLFAPDLEQRFPALAGVAGVADAEVGQAARRERAVLHRGMFLWFSDREPERGLRKLRRVAQVMRRAAATAGVQGLFLALEALIISITDNSTAAGAAVRRLVADVDHLLKRLAESGEAALAAALPFDLLRNLLFYVATSGSPHHVVSTARRENNLRLLAVTGADGLDQAARRLQADVARARAGAGQVGRVTGPLLATVQRLADGLALAQLGAPRRELVPLLGAMRRVAAGEGGVGDPLPELEELLAKIGDTLGGREFAEVPAVRVAPPFPASMADNVLAEVEDVEVEVTDTDEELELLALEMGAGTPDGESAVEPGASLEVLAPRNEELDGIFRDEAPEKVEAMRHRYVAWSAQRDDSSALDAVLWVLDSLKSTGRLVGADALSDVCWVLEAALGSCRDGSLAVSDDVIGVLDEGIEMVDALVSAHIGGHPVEGDPRAVEQRIYALLSPAAAAEVAAAAEADAGRPVPEGGSAVSDLGALPLFVEEAGELVDELAEVLNGLEEDPARSAWLIEMRRAARALAEAARQAGVVDLVAAGEALDGLLGRVTEAGGAVAPGPLALAREAIHACVAALDALRHERAVQLPAGLVERLRAADPTATTAAVAETDRSTAPGGSPVAGDRAPDRQSGLSYAQADALFERAGGTGVSHFLLEEQVAVLREQVGRLEGLLALLRRPARGQPAEVLPPRVATALDDLAGCADRLHESSLAISSQLRAQGHQFSELQHLLGAAVERQGAPTFVDLLLVEVGESVYALPTAAVESVRRIAAELLPAQGGALELRGRSYAFRPLADVLGVPAGRETVGDRPRSIVLARVGGAVQAYGVDRVRGQRTLLVRPPEAGVDSAPWASGLVALGADRVAPVVDLEALPGG